MGECNDSSAQKSSAHMSASLLHASTPSSGVAWFFSPPFFSRKHPSFDWGASRACEYSESFQKMYMLLADTLKINNVWIALFLWVYMQIFIYSWACILCIGYTYTYGAFECHTYEYVYVWGFWMSHVRIPIRMGLLNVTRTNSIRMGLLNVTRTNEPCVRISHATLKNESCNTYECVV